MSWLSQEGSRCGSDSGDSDASGPWFRTSQVAFCVGSNAGAAPVVGWRAARGQSPVRVGVQAVRDPREGRSSAWHRDAPCGHVSPFVRVQLETFEVDGPRGAWGSCLPGSENCLAQRPGFRDVSHSPGCPARSWETLVGFQVGVGAAAVSSRWCLCCRRSPPRVPWLRPGCGMLPFLDRLGG